MGFAYAQVHLNYNLPVALFLTALYGLFMTTRDWQKLLTLVFIATTTTIPWDSYLVRHRIWTYPPDAVIGWTLWSIPIEEVFFFIIQTYNTGLAYGILTRRLVLPAYLRTAPWMSKTIGALVITLATIAAGAAVHHGGRGVYLGLIVVWSGPFLLIQWLFSSSFILALPKKELIASIMIPTTFLCAVDTICLARGTWVIEKATKLDIQLHSLDIEEAIFFLTTNTMIVLGLVSIDHALALSDSQTAQSSVLDNPPSYIHILARFLSSRDYNPAFSESLAKATEILKTSSQSMYTGSAVFQGPLRIDLIFLYSFFRVIDDLVDTASDTDTPRIIKQCNDLLQTKFSAPYTPLQAKHATPPDLLAAIDNLPVSRLNLDHLQDTLKGFQIDTSFTNPTTFPISTEKDLDRYSFHVASTVASSILELISHHFPTHPSTTTLDDEILPAGQKMGQALQYINVARDVAQDARIGRVYLPASWLKCEGLSSADVLASPRDPRINRVRARALDRADELSACSRDQILKLPGEVRGPLLATVDSYLEIGCVLRSRKHMPSEKVRVPLWRRLWVVYQAML